MKILGDDLAGSKGRYGVVLILLLFPVISISALYHLDIGESEGLDYEKISNDHDLDIDLASEDDPNIVIVTMESLPYNRVNCYGYHRETMPNLCELANNATLYQNVYPVDGKTPLSTVGTETGRYPFEIGVRNEQHTIRDEVTTMGEFFDESGYKTYQEGLPTRIYPELGRGYDERPQLWL